MGRDELLDIVGGLASESSRYVSRAVKVEQRSLFRDVLGTLEEGSSPVVSIQIGKNHFDFESWAAILAYGVFKSLLASGTSAHFSANPLMGAIFPSVIVDNSMMSAVEKRLTLSKNSAATKSRHVKRGGDRDAKRAANTQFIVNDY